MYVLQCNPNANHTVLHELDKKGLRLAKRAYPHHHFEVVSGLHAHRWVHSGFIHTTPLYIENGRIRYSRDAS
jgi:hypothetical protein